MTTIVVLTRRNFFLGELAFSLVTDLTSGKGTRINFHVPVAESNRKRPGKSLFGLKDGLVSSS